MNNVALSTEMIHEVCHAFIIAVVLPGEATDVLLFQLHAIPRTNK
jgi:hypothetical protein